MAKEKLQNRTKIRGAEMDVSASITKALDAVRLADQEAREDLRTSGTACTDYLRMAVQSLENAAEWMRGLAAEESANEKPDKKNASPEPKAMECVICDASIPFGDESICSGCDGSVCQNCMGDEGVCKACEKD